MMRNTFRISFFVFVIHSAVISSSLAERLAGGRKQPLSIPLKNHYNRVYYGEIGIGTPPQHVQVLFDSASTDLIVIGTELKKKCRNQQSGKCPNENPLIPYERLDSTTYKEFEDKFDVTFLDNAHFAGCSATEVIEMGGVDSQIRVTVPIGVATTMSEVVSEEHGMFGLGFIPNTNFNSMLVTPFESIIAQTGLPAQFSWYARREPDIERYDLSGELYIGGYNTEYMDSDFKIKVKVNKMYDKYIDWNFSVDGIRVDGNDAYTIWLKDGDLDGDGIPGTLAMPDTATSKILFPPPIYNLLARYVYNGKISQNILDQDKFLCESLPKYLPKIELIVNNREFLDIDPANYITRRVGNACSTNLETSEHENIILGQSFFHEYYTMFDYKNKEINFAKAKQPPTTDDNFQPSSSRKESSTY